MRLLIDGYNLLHATDLFGAGTLAGTLRGSREALLGYLAERLTERERAGAIVVFDAAQAPPGLPDTLDCAGMTVRFARGYPDADALIEEILAASPGGRGLLVVSSDHRVQRAARSRGARRADSEAWFRELAGRTPLGGGDAARPDGAGLGDAAEWVRAFSDPGLEELARRAATEPAPPLPSPSDNPAAAGTPRPEQARRDPRLPARRAPRRRGATGGGAGRSQGEFGEGVFEGFPPGYGEDLLGGDGPPAR